MRTNWNWMTKPHLLILLAMVLATGHQVVFMHWTCDDAFISYRYAENLTQGKGLVFNPGEKVEGYSNFSWVALLALFNILGLSPLWVSKALSLIFSLLIVAFVFKTARASGVGPGGALLGAFLVSTASSLAYFSMSGLETILYTFFLLLAVYLNKKFMASPSKKTLLFLYAVCLWAAITRPEGILFLLITVVIHTRRGVRQKKFQATKVIYALPLLFLSLYAGFILLRYLYYRDILPNTYYAKPLGTFVEAGYNAFFVNFASGLISGTFLLIPLILFMVKRRLLLENLYPLLFCLAQVFFMSYTGDWMAFGRFFFPIFPLAVILNLTLLGAVRTGYPKQKQKFLAPLGAFGVWLVFAGLNVWQTTGAVAAKEYYPFFVMNSARLTELGRWLADNFPPDTTISLRRQGAVPYYSEMRSLDFLGLTDKTIARLVSEEKDPQEESRKISRHIIQQKPDLVILFSSKSEVSGWPIEKSPESGKLNHLEYLIRRLATKEGYSAFKDIPMGGIEEAHLLSSPAPTDPLR
jgi:arabinofuranosyltransferase